MQNRFISGQPSCSHECDASALAVCDAFASSSWAFVSQILIVKQSNTPIRIARRVLRPNTIGISISRGGPAGGYGQSRVGGRADHVIAEANTSLTDGQTFLAAKSRVSHRSQGCPMGIAARMLGCFAYNSAFRKNLIATVNTIHVYKYCNAQTGCDTNRGSFGCFFALWGKSRDGS